MSDPNGNGGKVEFKSDGTFYYRNPELRYSTNTSVIGYFEYTGKYSVSGDKINCTNVYLQRKAVDGTPKAESEFLGD